MSPSDVMMLMTLTTHRKPASKKITLIIRRESKTFFELSQEKRKRDAEMPPPRSLKPDELDLDNLQDCGSRYELGYVIGSGVCADVYEALDTQNGNKKVAVKVQKINPEFIEDIREEYRMLRDLSSHSNVPDFYGAYMKKHQTHSEIWFVMQYCEGGPVTDLVRALIEQGKRMSELHIAFILKEVITGMIFLHQNHVMHRDLRGSNIVLTKEGEVKIVDFGLSRETANTFDKKKTFLGSPSWMAPEIMRCGHKEVDGYDNRIDVWALGITAIELGDGKPPFQDMHPTRALFQIVRNPPPGLYRASNWSQHYVDFIAECLEKNPEHRPYMAELLEHPFITSLPENDIHLASELKILLEHVTPIIKTSRKEEARIRDGFLKYKDRELQTMHVEDLAALETISEDNIVQELEERHNAKNHYSFVGDVLLFINPNTHLNLYGTKYHFKYKFKSRSDNEPHIYAVADGAYQDMMHHEEAQHIVLAGETLAGKTTSLRHLLKHLIFLGQGAAKVGEKIEKCLNILHAIGNAGTPINHNSTRHVLYLQVTYGMSGKLSGAIFWMYQLEKWRVTGNRDPLQANFHIFYYFYDAMDAAGELDKYFLEPGRKYRYLRADIADDKIPKGPRETPEENSAKFQEIYQTLNDIEFNDIQMEIFSSVLAAILLIGEVKFESSSENTAELANPEVAAKVAKLLTMDEKKFQWALCNYCVVKSGTAERRRHTKEEAEEAREVLARTMYTRLADWIVNVINLKLSLVRAIFGDKHCVGILDMFGFECYQKNEMEQLFVNTLNEQLQYSYNQKVFVWEMQEQEEEEVPITPLQYYDNKPTIDELLNKPDGLMYIIDDATRSKEDGAEYIIQTITNSPKGPRIKMSNSKDFCVAHYTGKVTYETRNIPRKNRDFLPPEMIETLRSSHNGIIKQLFSNQLTRSGNLTLTSDQNVLAATGKKKRWGAALVGADSSKLRKYNTESRGEFSQTRRMRTASSVFRASSLEILKALTGGGTKFVRCIRSDLSGTPEGWQSDVVKQQIRALGVVDTARARQKGYSIRVSFADFIQRYRFLAFDFDEPVDVTKENCRLLLIRLKMEGWMIGKSKVFLRYYNEEYLARLYETQVKKIVKVQCMMRTFLARKRVAPKIASRQASRDSVDGKFSRGCSVDAT